MITLFASAGCPRRLLPRGYSRLLHLCLVITLFSVTSLTAHAQSADDCRSAVEHSLAREQRLYRSVVFGRNEAEKEAVGTVRFSDDGRSWYKNADDTWTHIGKTQADEQTIGDLAMDASGEQDLIGQTTFPRRGILRTKRTVTSSLLPHLLQSYRALQCRTEISCERARQSIDLGAPEEGEGGAPNLEINIPGCIPVELPPIEECRIEQSLELTDMVNYCNSIKETLLSHEEDVLKMTVEYDAAYRSLVQFAGAFDDFLHSFRWSLTGNLRASSYIIGWLHRLPCFLGTCDDAYPAREFPEAP